VFREIEVRLPSYFRTNTVTSQHTGPVLQTLWGRISTPSSPEFRIAHSGAPNPNCSYTNSITERTMLTLAIRPAIQNVSLHNASSRYIAHTDAKTQA